MHYEYKAVPAPRKGRKAKGVKTAEARFAYAIQTLMNDMAADGWEFQRAETLPSDERHGLKSSHTVYRDLLVFRRARAEGEIPVNSFPLPSQDAEDQAAELHPEDTADAPDTVHDNTDDDILADEILTKEEPDTPEQR